MVTQYRTQKAAGIKALRDYPVFETADFLLISTSDDLSNPCFGFPLFARPCPMRPRHGFVDSRIVRSREELTAVWNDAIAADPESELILMTLVDARYSAILAGNRLTIGPGNDGATGGKSAVDIGVVPVQLPPKLLNAGRIASGETAFLEFVKADNSRPLCVQLRAGPAIPNCADWIPNEIKVSAVVSPSDDLLTWETQTKTFASGTVVYAPGGSLASHAAIHCVVNGIPYVTTFEPKIGDTLQPTGDATFTLDRTEFLRGGAWAVTKLTTGEAKKALKLALVVLHNWSEMRKFPNASRLLGAACRAMAVAGAAICAGEARHYSLKKKCQIGAKVSRETKIDRMLCASSRVQRRALTLAAKAFAASGWKGGYGGYKWGDCALAVDRLWRAQAEPTLSEATLVEALNRLVNAAHNNGALLNKLVSPDHLDFTASNPTMAALRLMGELHQCVSATIAPAKPFAQARPLPRPRTTTWKNLQVRIESSNAIKAQVWECVSGVGGSYISHHMSGPAEVCSWIAGQKHTEKSRANSDVVYVPIPLKNPIKAKTDTILNAIRAAMGNKS